MPVDVSTYGPPKTGTSPIETLAGVAQIQNLRNQNQLFQQQYNTNLGMGRIYKEAIDPNTGVLDPNKANALMSQDPNVTLAIPEAIRNSQAATLANTQIDTAKLQNAQQHLTTMTQYLSGLLATPNPSSNDIASTLAKGINAGVITQPEALSFWADLPRGPDGKIDESGIRPLIQQNLMRTLSAQQQLEALSPAPTMVNTGQAQVPVRLPQVGNPSVAGPGIPNLPAPTQQYFNPQTGQQEYVGNLPGGGMGGGGLPSGTPAAPALGTESAANVAGQASAQQGVGLQTRADQVPQTKALLGNLEGALSEFAAGPGADWKRVAKSFVNANNPFGNVFDPQAIASQDSFNKQALQLAQAQFQALGGTGTDAKLDSTMHTSPNAALSKMSNIEIINMLKGNEDAIAAKNQAWQAWLQQGNSPASYGKFSTDFNKQYDPRVFQSIYNTPQDNKKMLSGMTKDEQKKFLDSYKTALRNGWVKLPGAQ